MRNHVIKDIIDNIESSYKRSLGPDYILYGQSGSGKTTLLLRIIERLKTDRSLSEKFTAILIDEGINHKILKHIKLWETLAKKLNELSEFSELLQYIDISAPDKSLEQIREALSTQDKKLIIFIEKIDDLFYKFKENDKKEFIGLLNSCSEISIIGTSLLELNFNSFKNIKLDGLNKDEVKDLLLEKWVTYPKYNIKEILNNESSRIETFRRLCNGIPGKMLIFLENLIYNKCSGDSVYDIRQAIEKLTPIYKMKMDRFSFQQQGIISVMALCRDAVKTSDIAKELGMESKAVSSHLNLLEKCGAAEKINTDSKNYLYRITDRFFNIWYIMMYADKQDKEFMLETVQFINLWLNCETISEKFSKFVVYNKDSDVISEHYKQLASSDPEIQYALSAYELAKTYAKKHEYKQAEKYYLQAADKNFPPALSTMARLYIINVKNKETALKYAKESYEKDGCFLNMATKAMAQLWNDKKDSIETFEQIFYYPIKNTDYYEAALGCMIFLLAKKQYDFVLKLFNDSSLDFKKRYPLIYFTLMSFVKKDFPNEFIKMGTEFAETAEEIIAVINELGIIYQ